MKWLFRRKSDPQAPSAPKPELDHETLQQLAKAGGNLALPTEIVNYLYVPDEGRARQAEAALVPAGYSVTVRHAASGPSWLALAKIEIVPSKENIALIRQRFDALASQLGGDYDGWEAAVTK